MMVMLSGRERRPVGIGTSNCSNGQDFLHHEHPNETAAGDFGGHWGLTLPLSARQTRPSVLNADTLGQAQGLTMDKPTLLWNKQRQLLFQMNRTLCNSRPHPRSR